MLSKIESFKQAHDSHREWQIDRPLIDKFNRSELGVALKLLSGEIDELNGGDKTGIFSKENINKDPAIEADYRQQEISDIMVFAMTCFDELGEEINTEEIYSRAGAWADAYSFNIVSPENTILPPPELTVNKNDTYEILKGKINEQAVIISNYDGKNTEGIGKALENILVYCVAMHSLLGVDSGRAIMEKVARNMIKYPAYMFALPIEEMNPDELEAHYHRVRMLCAVEFDGEYDEELGDKPKIGTTKFYINEESQRVSIELNDEDQWEELTWNEMTHDERCPLGILYIYLAARSAGKYGESVQISEK